MRVIVCSPLPEIAAQISVAATLAEIECETEPSLQAFCSRLFRDPDCVGVFWNAGPASAAKTVRRLRLAEVRNVLFAILDAAYDVGQDAGSKGRAMALDAGCDDCQFWPVDDRELIARLRAIERRQRDAGPEMIQLPGCVFNPETGTVTGDDHVVFLTAKQSKLLAALASRPGLCISKAMCMLALYDGRDEAQIKIIDVFVCKLRAKLFRVTGGLDVIETVWGQGYRFKPEGFVPRIFEARRRVAQ